MFVIEYRHRRVRSSSIDRAVEKMFSFAPKMERFAFSNKSSALICILLSSVVHSPCFNLFHTGTGMLLVLLQTEP